MTGQGSVFQGETAITIDDKGRLAIPTGYRDVVAQACGNRLVVTYNPFESGSLYLYPQDVWERVRDQVNALPRTRSVSRNLQLKLVGAATFVEPMAAADRLPGSHRNAVGIEEEGRAGGHGRQVRTVGEQAHLAQIRQTLGDADLGDELVDLQL